MGLRATPVLALLALSWLGAGNVRADLPVPTEAQAKAWAEKVDAELAQGSGALLQSSLDAGEIVGRALEGLDLPAGMAEGVERGFAQGGSLAAALEQVVQAGGRVELVRLTAVDGERGALFRVVPADGGVNYNEFLLGRTESGEIRVVDVFMIASGERISATLRSNLLQVLAAQGDRSLLQRVAGQDSELLDAMPRIALLASQVQAGRGDAAMKTWQDLPESAKGLRQAALMRLMAAQSLGDADYIAALDDFGKRFPKDPAFALWSIDAHVVRENWPLALKAVDQLDDLVGGDAFLNDLRGNVLVLAGRHDEAKAAFAALREAYPEFDEWRFGFLTLAVAQGDHAATGRLLNELDEVHGYDAEAMVKDPLYEDFRASDEYAAWRIARQPR